MRRTVIEVWIRDFSPVVGDLGTLTLQARSTKRNGAPQRRFGKACQGLLLKSPAVGRSWNHLKMVVDLRCQDTPRLHGLIWTYIGIYRIIAQDSTLNWMVYEIINDYHFLLSECSFAGASKNTQMVQRGSLAPRRMSGTFANICAMSSLGMPSIYIYRYLHWYVHCYTGPYSIFKYQFFTCLEESDPTDRKWSQPGAYPTGTLNSSDQNTLVVIP